jgi:short subunit dehydrogenase-like uncharacterized protein
MASDPREHDLVLFGATGFTGGLTAEYLARHAPPDARWALAGRSLGKLEAVRERLARISPAAAGIPLLVGDVTDRASMEAIARCTRVVISTVGPYITFGEPLVAACAAAGTDYGDLTGEPEFVDRMFVAHDGRAQESGARIVHCCGFDSIPHDLGAQFTVQQLPEGVPLTVQGFVRAEAMISGGTYQSVITGLGRARQLVAAQRERARREPAPDPARQVGALRNRPHREPVIENAWAVPLPTIDPSVILRSARAQPRYGPDFRYAHNAWVKRLPVAMAAGAGLSGMLLLAQLPPTRKLLHRAIAAGTGPSPQRREKSTFRVRFLGEGGGRRVVCEVSGGDPGYDETAKMLAETGLCLAFDETPSTAGQVTTAQALGPALRDRLVRAGMRFDVLENAAA